MPKDKWPMLPGGEWCASSTARAWFISECKRMCWNPSAVKRAFEHTARCSALYINDDGKTLFAPPTLPQQRAFLEGGDAIPDWLYWMPLVIAHARVRMSNVFGFTAHTWALVHVPHHRGMNHLHGTPINLLDRLIEYHHTMKEHRRLTLEVSTLISSFEALLTVPIPDNTDELVKARVALVQSVNAYIANLGAQVSDAANDPHISSWKEAHSQVVELRGRYSEHIGRFSSSTIKTDWPAYRASSRHLMTAMRDHLNRVTAFTPIR